MQRLWTLVPGHLSSHSALSSYGLCAAHSLATLCLCTTSGPDPGELPGFWGSMVFRHAPKSLGRGRVNNNNNNFNSRCPSEEEYSSAAVFTSLALNAAKSSIPFGRIKRPPKAWWSAEVEGAVSERRKAFSAAHRSDEDRQAYISASRRASSVIATWQMTCSSFSPKFNPKSVHSLLRSGTGSPSSSTSFLNCSSPRKSALVFADCPRFHFSVSQPKALRSRARGYRSELRRATCLEESHSSFCCRFYSTELLAAVSNLSSSTATGPDKVVYLMLKHLPHSGMDFLHIFNLSWFLRSFPSIWETFSIIPIYKMGKPLDFPAFFRPISLTSCVSKLFKSIILSRVFFFLKSDSIFSPRQAGFRPGRTTLDQTIPCSVHLGQTVLFLLAKTALAYLPTALALWH